MSFEERKKSEDMTMIDKAHYEKEIKTCTPSRGDQEEVQGPLFAQGPLSAFSFCSEYHPQIKKKKKHVALSIDDAAKKLGAMWDTTAVGDKKEKYEKEMAAYRTKVKPGAVKTGVVKKERGKKKKEERDEENDEEENDKLTAPPPRAQLIPFK